MIHVLKYWMLHFCDIVLKLFYICFNIFFIHGNIYFWLHGVFLYICFSIFPYINLCSRNILQFLNHYAVIHIDFFSYLNRDIVMLEKFIIPVVSIFLYALSSVQCDLKLPVEWYHHYNDYSYNVLCISLIYICHRYTWFLLYLQLNLCTCVAILLFIYYC